MLDYHMEGAWVYLLTLVHQSHSRLGSVGRHLPREEGHVSKLAFDGGLPMRN